MDKKEQILQEIRRVANAISPEPLTYNYFKRKSSIPISTVLNHFGTFNRAVEAAGLKPNPRGVPVSGYKRISDEELLEAIGALWKKVGLKPTVSLMRAEGQFSEYPYTKRWGSLRAAIEAYIQKYGEPQVFEGPPSQTEKPKHKKVPVIIPKTFKPLPTAEKKRGIVYGEPIDFRGLRYAPVNEQGVVYLFGLVSRELGFLIESIRTDFPDCEGKRCLNPEGTRWQHVRIEFEYKSSNFAEHGHDPEGCDLIVCWLHDWADAPLEVLELKSAISLLPKE